jgi:hypothetical protein
MKNSAISFPFRLQFPGCFVGGADRSAIQKSPFDAKLEEINGTPVTAQPSPLFPARDV